MVDYRPRTTVPKSIDALRAGSTVLLAGVGHDTAVEQHNGFTFTSRHSPRQSSRALGAEWWRHQIAPGLCKKSQMGGSRTTGPETLRMVDGRMVESPRIGAKIESKVPSRSSQPCPRRPKGHAVSPLLALNVARRERPVPFASGSSRSLCRWRPVRSRSPRRRARP
jgi:hypothetical protein